MLVIASMIGIGCFLSSGYALGSLGNPNRVILAWVLCGVWAITGAIGYGAIARRVPLSGGEYLYLTQLVHPAIGFLAGWISLVAGFTVPIAAMAKTVVEYAMPAVAEPTQSALWASLIIAATVVLHAVGVQVGATAQNLIVLVKLGLLALLLSIAAGQANNAEVWQGRALPGRETGAWPTDRAGIIALLASMSWISLSYTGFNAAIYVAGESKRAQRTVPQSMLWASLLVTGIYVALNAMFVWAADSQAVAAAPPQIAILAVTSVAGSNGQLLLRSIVALAVLSSVFSMLMAGPRVYAQMARDGVMPKVLDFAGGVPRAAIVLQGLLSIAVVWLSTLEQLIGYLGMTLSACSALAVASVWCFNKAQKFEGSPVRWWEYTAAAVYILGTIAMLAGVIADGQKRDELWAMCATFVVGAVIYLLWKQAPMTGSRR